MHHSTLFNQSSLYNIPITRNHCAMSASTPNERSLLLDSTPSHRVVQHFADQPLTLSPERILPPESARTSAPPAPLRDIQPIQQGPNPNLSDRNLGIPLNEVEDHVTTVVLKYLAKVVGTFLSTSASLFGLSFFRPEKGKLGKEPLAFLAFSL